MACNFNYNFNYNLLLKLRTVCLSVYPSVCLSHACFVTNPKNEPTGDIFIPHERAILLVFCDPIVVGGRRPLPSLSDSPPSKIAHVDRFNSKN